MSGNDILIETTKRDVIRKQLRELRDNDQVPVVLHNHGKPSTHLQADYMQLKKMYKEAGRHHPVEVVVDGKKHLALIKQVDIEPTKQRLRHVVFQAIRQNEKATAEIPIVLEDVEIPAERAGLLVLRHLDYVEVEALPKNLPDELLVDPSGLVEVGDTITVGDLKIPSDVTLLTDPEYGIATVEMPRDQIAEADAAAAGLAEDAESSADVPASEQQDEVETDDDEEDEAEKTASTEE